MEIVSDPAMHTADEAYAYLSSLRATMIYGGISDCDMEKGQLRCDANISIRPVGATHLGTKVELKNLNSISFVRDGIEHEIKRQIAVVERGGTLVQETRDYDGQTGTSQSLRSKEMAHDYRYFPDPRPHAREGRRRVEIAHPSRVPRAAFCETGTVLHGLPNPLHPDFSSDLGPGFGGLL
jgi:Asp-tRNA(Asn)/Glu-tRNA(Gln) amidotransferase B subunit